MRNFYVGFRTHGVIGMVPPEKARTVILQRLSSDSTVEAIAAAESIPLNGILPAASISAGAKTSDAWYNHVSPEFFSLLDIPIIEGRNFTMDEAKSGAPVAIISQLTASRLWPKGDALGREIIVRHDAEHFTSRGWWASRATSSVVPFLMVPIRRWYIFLQPPGNWLCW